MSSAQKSWPPAQVYDLNDGVTVAYPTPTDEYRGGDENILQDENPESAKKTRISDKRFVQTWLSCDSYDVMALNVGMTVSAVQARATRLRKAKVELPTFTRATRKRKSIDVVDLNNMIKNNQKVITTGETTNE